VLTGCCCRSATCGRLATSGTVERATPLDDGRAAEGGQLAGRKGARAPRARALRGDVSSRGGRKGERPRQGVEAGKRKRKTRRRVVEWKTKGWPVAGKANKEGSSQAQQARTLIKPDGGICCSGVVIVIVVIVVVVVVILPVVALVVGSWS